MRVGLPGDDAKALTQLQEKDRIHRSTLPADDRLSRVRLRDAPGHPDCRPNTCRLPPREEKPDEKPPEVRIEVRRRAIFSGASSKRVLALDLRLDQLLHRLRGSSRHWTTS
jgi:hypothetical protein